MLDVALLTNRSSEGFGLSRDTSGSSKGKGFQSKGSGKGKGQWSNRPRRSLQDRIMNSTCRICNKKGHWKAECPFRQSSTAASASGMSHSSASGTLPTTTVIADQGDDMLPLEFVQLPEFTMPKSDESQPSFLSCHRMSGVSSPCYVGVIHGESNGDNMVRQGKHPTAYERIKARFSCKMQDTREFTSLPRKNDHLRPTAMTAMDRIQRNASPRSEASLEAPRQASASPIWSESQVCFATHASYGILDLGASKTVIGSDCLPELIRSLDADTQKQLTRCPCHVTFRFGNEATLSSNQALVIPLGKLLLKVAIVPGGTPFLLSNTLMRVMEASIDCAKHTLSSKMFNKPVKLQLTPKGLFLIDINCLIQAAKDNQSSSRTPGAQTFAETFVSDEVSEKGHPKPTTITAMSDHTCPRQQVDTSMSNQYQDESQEFEAKRMSESLENKQPKSFTAEYAGSPPAQSAPVPQVKRKSVGFREHVSQPAPSKSADTSQHHRVGQPRAPDLGRSESRSSDVRTEVRGMSLPRHVARSGVGPIHGEQVSEKHERGSSPLLAVRGVEGRDHGVTAKCHPSTVQLTDHRARAGQSKGQSQPSGSSSHLFARWGGRLGYRTRDICLSDYDRPEHLHSGGHESHSRSHAAHGECTVQGDSTHRGPSIDAAAEPCGRGSVREDWGEEVLTAMHSETCQLYELVSQFDQELQDVLQQTPALGSRWLLGEVMCGENSQLIHQVQQLGKSAFRFSYQNGDLSTVQGRAALFQVVGRHRPKHLWYSPTCGPWSSWSRLNESRSLLHQREYAQKRKELMYQIALGISLYRHQIMNGDHFHWEQPQRSLMFQNPNLAEVHQHTQACQFDMCRAGGLVDPESQMPMKKGMTVLTTHAGLYSHFHGMVCDQLHQHQPIEGSCRPNKNGPMMLRSEYTENYTRKFARAVARVFAKANHQWPFNWKPGMICFSSPENDAFAATSKVKQPPQFARSELLSPTPHRGPGDKRIRSKSHQGNEPSLEMCQQAIQAISAVFPRVGTREITDGELMQQIQNIFPDKEIVRVMGCKGSERTVAPPSSLHPHEAPFRKALILRRDGSIQYEKNWERWIHLSKRQLTRPAHASRLNITAFAKDRDHSQTCQNRDHFMESNAQENAEPGHEAPGTESKRDPDPGTASDPEKKPSMSSIEPSQDGDSKQVDEMIHRKGKHDQEVIHDTIMQQQSLRFRQLPRWEQQTILRMHKNLGHPANDRLARALQISGSRPAVVQAAQEIQCRVCAANAPPKHSRPATLKSMLDFNHRIYLDGVTWTNQKGKSYHFYHILDAGTNYHVAIAAPSKATEDLIQIMNQHWISWAGPPQELVTDSGTEMNSVQFEEFVQRFNIRHTTTAPEAHWQNGKVERHGGFLQSMLDKIDMEHPISDYEALQMSLNQATHAKNTLSIRHGYAPEIIVFGKQSRLPGSVLCDESRPAHEHALGENSPSSQEFRQMLAVRETARKAYHVADNSDALRRAALRRSCPSRGRFDKGDWVMIWKENPLKQARWQGPHRVIIQDDQYTVWCTSGGKIHRSAPENTRKAFPEEGSPEGPELPPDITPMMQQIQRMQAQAQAHNPMDSDNITSETNNPQDNGDNPHNPPDSNNENENNENADSDLINQPSNNNTETDSQDDSIPQPDQEPDNATSDDIPLSSGDQNNGEPNMLTMENSKNVIRITCQEPENALTCEVMEPVAWRCEFDYLGINATHQTPDEAESWILLATSAKKQRTEVKLTELTPTEKAEFQAAKESEVQNWIKTGTISTVLRNQIPEEQILRCRWILTWKPIDTAELKETSERTHKAKARLVVLGYLDPRIEEIPRDSPTLNKTSRMIALQVIASHNWTMRSFDIKAAFLQGQPQADRVTAIDPVPELRKALGMKPQEVCRLNKSAYGLIDAPFLWYCALVSELVKLGFEQSPFDPCLMILRSYEYDGTARLEGILGIHVDDGIGGGSEIFEAKVRQLEAKFPFGSHKVSSFTFTGIEMTQHHDYSISMNQSAYVRKIKPIPIEANRKTQLESNVNEEERLALRALVGSLQYAAINTRPDLSSKLSLLQSSINRATVETLMEGNRVLHEAKKHHDVTIHLKPIPPKTFRFLAFSDASFSSPSKPDSHAGSIIVGTHQDISQNMQCPISPLAWGCRKIQKVVTSTLAAETMALSTTLDHLSWLRLFWSWIHDPSTEWKQPEMTLQKLAPAITIPTKHRFVAITDCKILYDLITKTAPPAMCGVQSSTYGTGNQRLPQRGYPFKVGSQRRSAS